MAAGRFARLNVLACGFFLLFSLSSCLTAHKKTDEISLNNGAPYAAELLLSHVADGSMNIVNVAFQKPFHGKLSADFEGKIFALYPLSTSSEGSLKFQGLFGVPHSHKPGHVELKISPEGFAATSLGFEVTDADYPSETLKVDNRKVNPRKRDMIRIKHEMAEIGQVYRVETLERYWDNPFVHPVDSVTTDQFGIKRLYNGQLRSYHGGMDFKAPMGTPIHAAGAGKVLLAKDLFFSGGTVIIDHGYGLLTMYFHMSKIDVKKGDLISDHQLLGLSGKSGRVTGPHLHFQVVVHQVKVNPQGLFEEIK